ncbi:MAG: ribonuclease P protein component [Bacteroidetes bacterium]|nr:ribonuclease P protein component [Bacteroidota bacterium]
MIPLVSLKGASTFSETIRLGKRFTHGIITVVIIFQPLSNDNKKEFVNVGVSIRKKTAKKATIRNRVKRLLRVSVRQVLTEFEDLGCFNQGCGFARIIVFCNSAPKIPSLINLEDVLPDVRNALSVALEYYKQRLNRYENNAHPTHQGL